MMEALFGAAVFGLAIGLVLGGQLEARKWRANAGAVPRIESGGRLYRVTDETPEREHPWRAIDRPPLPDPTNGRRDYDRH